MKLIIKRKKFFHAIIMIMTIMIFFSITIFKEYFLAHQDVRVMISSTGEKSELSNSNEVLIKKILLDDKNISLNEIKHNSKWYLKEDKLIADGKTEPLIIDISKTDLLEIEFVKHAWSGECKIQIGTESYIIDLYADKTENYIWHYSNPNVINYFSNINLSFMIMIISIFYFFAIKFLFALNKDRKIIGTIKCGNLLSIIFLFYFHILYQALETSLLKKSTYFILCIFTLIAGYKWNEIRNKNFMKKYWSTSGKILTFIISIYTTFAIFGHTLFLKELAMEISIEKIILFVYLSIWVYMCFLFCIYFIESNKNNIFSLNIPNKKQIKRFKAEIFLIQIVFLLIISIAFYPANITGDGIDQWSQAMGRYNINSAHTPVHTLFLKACISIVNNPYIVVIVQILLFSILITSFASFAYKKGAKKIFLFCAVLLLLILPNTWLMITLISKNIIFAYTILWSMYLMLLLIENPIKFFKKPLNDISLILAMIFVNYIRHNGFLVLYILIASMLFCTIKYWKQIKIIPLMIIIGVFISSWIIENPIYSYFDVQVIKSSGGKTPIIRPIGSCIAQDKYLSDDILDFARQIAPLEQWKEYYNPYDADKFSFSSPKPNMKNVSTADALKIYLSILQQYPDVVIKDRLDSMDLLWDVYNNGIKQYRFAIGILIASDLKFEKKVDWLDKKYVSESGNYFKPNMIYPKISGFIDKSYEIQIFDMICWRNGIYIILFLLVSLVLFLSKEKRYLLIMLPALAALFSYILAYCWQNYQYLWFFPLSVWMYMISIMGIYSNTKIKSRSDK